MNRRWGWLGVYFIAHAGMAADLGTWGDLYPIQEQDMLNVIHQRLEQLQRSGEWSAEMDAFKQRVITHSQRPTPVSGIGKTTKYESRIFDPSIQIAQDMKDDKGRVFARKGEIINPLKVVPFVQTLYFIDGDDPEQIAWMKRQQPETLQVKIILVNGDIPKTSELLDSRIYFDQNGVLCQKFGLQTVPARITSAPSGLRLLVESIPVEGER
ncbi:type-F conjugative transfer system protein TraW [Xenorhabdus sp. XENO-1]|nr:type-F conjugative transfer system protein TraW [Xenorhabdus bovienii]MCP9269146.1 type-F conjugative transfer system protein TraW [Xenorhabdus bovienii subsp. africana]